MASDYLRTEVWQAVMNETRNVLSLANIHKDRLYLADGDRP